jgi:hypothetical protein
MRDDAKARRKAKVWRDPVTDEIAFSTIEDELRELGLG